MIRLYPAPQQEKYLSAVDHSTRLVYQQCAKWDLEYQQEHGESATREYLVGLIRENRGMFNTGGHSVQAVTLQAVATQYQRNKHNPHYGANAWEFYVHRGRTHLKAGHLQVSGMSRVGNQIPTEPHTLTNSRIRDTWIVHRGSQWWLIFETDDDTMTAKQAARLLHTTPQRLKPYRELLEQHGAVLTNRGWRIPTSAIPVLHSAIARDTETHQAATGNTHLVSVGEVWVSQWDTPPSKKTETRKTETGNPLKQDLARQRKQIRKLTARVESLENQNRTLARLLDRVLCNQRQHSEQIEVLAGIIAWVWQQNKH